MASEKNEPIDFVVSWVDGGDSAWLAKRAEYLEEGSKVNEARYRDWGLLPYWFRCVEKYAPWVRTIHFVTWGHLPPWLNTNHPKLHIVNHKDYIPEKYLPTFNSHTIELNLHRIEGLSENFVYFNDDFFITKPVTPDFFFCNGLPKDTFGLRVIPLLTKSNGMIYANCTRVINDHFKADEVFRRHWKKFLHPQNGIRKVCRTILLRLLSRSYFPGFFSWHVCFNFQKSTFFELWEAAYEEMDQTCLCKFRQPTNVGPFLVSDWQMVQGRFLPRRSRYGKVYHLKRENIEEACDSIRNRRYTVICINDNSMLKNVDQAIQKTTSAFKELVPDKCSFEL